ncbi:MAG TPA: GNAT family N-acetyltransferase [Gemmataceae bacterium]|nr:GNAT family N-acetyltransferase [Gemmataceae bacterium]
MRGLQLPLTAEQFRELPRNSAFRYDYLDGTAYLVPRPRHYHAMLDLAPVEADPVDGVALRALGPDDWEALVPLFAESFGRAQPFAGLDDATRRDAAGRCLTRTRSGGDGPWIEQASFVAVGEDGAAPLGALLVTLLPEGDPCEWGSYQWFGDPPPDCIRLRLGRPHLTWVFVHPGCAGGGLGTRLLAAAVRELMALGFRELLSTFMIGNDRSALWHWRNGFRLLAYPGSQRRRS